MYSVPPGVRSAEAREYDDPVGWWGRKSLEEIIEARSSMVSGVVTVKVTDVEKLYESEISLAGVSERPVDSEVKLSKLPTPRLHFNPVHQPVSPRAPAERVRVVSNPRVDRRVERLIWDEVRAHQGVVELYRRGVDVYTIQRVLSLGLLGIRINRRLVPLRWSITAVDTAISRYLLSKLRGADTVSTPQLFYAEYLGNRFWILIEPGAHEIRWVEVWHPSAGFAAKASEPIVVLNHERVGGRPSFLDGGYEAAKLAVLEHLYRIGRQARVTILREITPRYYAAVGNWHIRESVRHALAAGSRRVSGPAELVEEVRRVSPVAAEALQRMIRSEARLRRLDAFLKR